MSRLPKHDVIYYVPGRKRPIADSTKATSDFLAMIHRFYPTATVNQLHTIITDRSQWLPNYDAINVLESHIAKGFGKFVPDWK